MKTVSSLLVLLSVLAFVVCIVGIGRPRLLRMRKRRHAAAAAGFAVVVCGFAIDVNPPPENEGPIGPGLLGFWLFCVGASWGMLILMRRRPAAAALRDAAVTVGGDGQTEAEVSEPGSRSLLAKVKSRAAAIKAEAKRRGDDARAAKSRHAEEVAQAAAVEAERRFLRQATRANGGGSSPLYARDERSRANYDYHSGDEEGEYGKILRRGTDGRPLVFEYASRYGEISDRMLFDWVEYPRHIQGVCQAADAVICFRKDRVTEWRAQTDKLLRAPKGRSRQ